MGDALGRLDELLDAVAEEEQADAVLVGDGREGERGRDFGGQVALGHGTGAVAVGGGDVDEEHQGQFALFAVFFHEGGAGAGGDVPVDRADVVAGLVLADFLELHALALEDRMVAARKDVLHRAAGADFDAADFAECFAGEHGVFSEKLKEKSEKMRWGVFRVTAPGVRRGGWRRGSRR